MTWVGAPTIYYGDEAGLCGFTDPDNRRTYPWGQEDKELIAFHKEMIRIHKENPVIRTGSLQMLRWSANILTYGRFSKDEQIIVALNNSKELKEVTIPVWKAEVPLNGRMQRLIYSYEDGYTVEHDEYIIENGEVVINMGKHSFVVMRTMPDQMEFAGECFIK